MKTKLLNGFSLGLILFSVLAFAQAFISVAFAQTGTAAVSHNFLNTQLASTAAIDCFIVLGMLIYFFLQWRMKKMRDASATFNPGIWVKDNWYNCVAYLLAIVFLFNDSGPMTPMAAIFIGMAPNQIIDFFGTGIEKLSK